MIELLVPFVGSFLGVLFGYYATLKYTDRQAKKLFRSDRARDAGYESGKVRNEKGLNAALVTDLLNEQSPLLAMVLNYFPSAKEYLIEHPNAIPYLIKMATPLIEKYMGNMGSGNMINPGSNNGQPRPFNMRL